MCCNAYQSSAHVFDGGDAVASEVELSFIEGVGELWGALYELCCYFHPSYKVCDLGV